MLSVGVISEDSNSQDIFEFVKKTKNVQLTGQYFSNPLENFRRASDSNITNFTDFDEFASSCDALIIPYIGTETYQLIIHALRKSRHALIGNPLIMEPDQMEHLMKLSEEANVIFKVMQKFRFHGSLMAAISYIHNPVYLEIRKDTTDHKLSIFDSLFHSIQPAVVINQTNMMKLQAVSTPLHTVSPDMINARIEFDNGCVANVTSSKYADSERFICKIHQANQQIQIDFHNQKVVLAEIGNDNLDPQPDTIETLFTNPLQDEIADFIQNILNHSHLNHFENGYATYLISRKIIEKISCESLSA